MTVEESDLYTIISLVKQPVEASNFVLKNVTFLFCRTQWSFSDAVWGSPASRRDTQHYQIIARCSVSPLTTPQRFTLPPRSLQHAGEKRIWIPLFPLRSLSSHWCACLHDHKNLITWRYQIIAIIKSDALKCKNIGSHASGCLSDFFKNMYAHRPMRWTTICNMFVVFFCPLTLQIHTLMFSMFFLRWIQTKRQLRAG